MWFVGGRLGRRSPRRGGAGRHRPSAGAGAAARRGGRDRPAARADRRRGRRGRRTWADRTRDRDRPGPVGGRAGRGRLPSVRNQPSQVARYRERHGTSGAKSDAADAHTLADMVRTDAHQLRPVAGDSALAEGVKVLTRAHQNLIWDRHRQMLRLRAALREFFPAALQAFPDLTAPDALQLLAAAPDPDRAARLSRSKIAAALRRARRRDVEAKAAEVQAAVRSAQLTQPAELAGAYAATVRASVALI